ncbi:peptidylprolyl isomerase [Kingella negevensis]|uniref:Peptidyl-prolyl cis-trans isomerase n=1 Tax=Kingella negevensis TaxID=1522312 RepID=A0A238T9M2_9NEIS|nr:peptidylprolyl isomerase [Kingella negevensis]MDK4684592.1 peptidylprolyl isomerase [Kingella negevensis]MDK4696263.1 peptidylprolyl isomerase [Kingella negevensis]MDK4707722.1 peptidylprolyl isomerase [Kingella negevensis]MDK4709842.1 peptidylprolyl isomerase [Kingella negevensis]WII92280.1 peptidylprolyl isomerase [Kingella negevensis]
MEQTIKKIVLATVMSTAAFAAHAETHAVIETNMGNIELSLDETKAPKTVANFVQYAKSGFYNNTIFHRVIDGFMIQGGGFTPDMIEKPTAKAINNEADNGLKNTVGTIAMARTAAPNSATSQFFINTANNDFLNHTSKTTQGYGYAVFGKVTKGMDVVNKISKVRTGSKMMHQDVPTQTVLIKQVRIEK